MKEGRQRANPLPISSSPDLVTRSIYWTFTSSGSASFERRWLACCGGDREYECALKDQPIARLKIPFQSVQLNDLPDRESMNGERVVHSAVPRPGLPSKSRFGRTSHQVSGAKSRPARRPSVSPLGDLGGRANRERTNAAESSHSHDTKYFMTSGGN